MRCLSFRFIFLVAVASHLLRFIVSGCSCVLVTVCGGAANAQGIALRSRFRTGEPLYQLIGLYFVVPLLCLCVVTQHKKKLEAASGSPKRARGKTRLHNSKLRREQLR